MSEKDELAKMMENATEVIDVLQLPAVTDWCSTGSTILDLAIANQIPGGIPVGRAVEVFGASSTAKSVLASTILGYALRSGKQAYLADTEHTFDPRFAAYYGLDSSHENFFYGYSYMTDSEKEKQKLLSGQTQPTTIEEFFDVYLAGVLKSRSRKPKIVIVDSLTILPAQIEIEKTMDKQGFGAYRAKQIGLGLRKYMGEMIRKNVTLFVINQTRDSLDMFGPKEVVPGGRSLEFQTSVRIYMQHDKKITNSNDKEIGVWVKFNINKNKVAPPFRDGHFKILFDYGLDDVTSMLSWLAEVQGGKNAAYSLTANVELPLLETQDHSTFSIFIDKNKEGEVIPTVSKRVIDWVPFIEENSLELELRNYVAEIWKGVYKTEERKPRVW